MPYNSKGEWVPEDDSVATRVTQITSKDSPLMRQAQGIGLATANRRGLLNSSMAVGAAQASTLAAAVPIASQDAQQTYGKNTQKMQSDTQFGLQRLQGEQQLGLQRLQGDQQTSLQKLQGEQATGIERLQGENRLAVQKLQGDQQSSLAQTQLAAAERERVAAALGQAAGDYTNSIAGTLANPDIPANMRAAVQAAQRDAMLARIDAIQRLYGVNVSWGGAAGPAPTTLGPGASIAPGAAGGGGSGGIGYMVRAA